MRRYLDAINFVITLQDINPEKIALWGDSLSAGQALVLGAFDSRIKVIISKKKTFRRISLSKSIKSNSKLSAALFQGAVLTIIF
jgi:uncharacterized protein